MFSAAVSVGTRLNAWKTNPTASRRSRVRSFSESVVRSTSPMKTWPSVGESSPAMQCSRVDLPEPDGPMIAVNSPAANSTETPAQRLDGRIALAVDLAERDGSRRGAARRPRWESIGLGHRSYPFVSV